MKYVFNFDMGVIILALACRFLLPSRAVLAVQSGGMLRGIAINRVMFWSVLAVGALWFFVRFLIRR